MRLKGSGRDYMISENLTAQNSTFLTSAKYERLLYYTKFWYCFEINLVQYFEVVKYFENFWFKPIPDHLQFPQTNFSSTKLFTGKTLRRTRQSDCIKMDNGKIRFNVIEWKETGIRFSNVQ